MVSNRFDFMETVKAIQMLHLKSVLCAMQQLSSPSPYDFFYFLVDLIFNISRTPPHSIWIANTLLNGNGTKREYANKMQFQLASFLLHHFASHLRQFFIPSLCIHIHIQFYKFIPIVNYECFLSNIFSIVITLYLKRKEIVRRISC